MSSAPAYDLAPRTQRFARFVTHHRVPFALVVVLATAFFAIPVIHWVASALGFSPREPSVRIDTRERDRFPNHPYVAAHDAFAPTFGEASLVALAVTVEDETLFQPHILHAIHEITRALDGAGFERHSEARETLRDALEAEESRSPSAIRRELDEAFPPYPVNHDQVRSLTHASTRVIHILPDGAIEQQVLVPHVPRTQAEADALRTLVRQSPPHIFGRLVSHDERAALITASFVTDRLSNKAIYQALFDHVQQIKYTWEEKIPGLRVHISGAPIARAWILTYTGQIALYLLASIAMIFVLLWLYFRRWHGVFIPMVAAGITAIWGLGFAGWMGIAFDPLILVIPMIITARAVSHTVQMAERFFEDYEVALPAKGDPRIARVDAATTAMGGLIVPGTLSIVTDVAGLLVILLTSIPQLQNLAIFGAFWVASIIITVEILHPLLICFLPAPPKHEHFKPRLVVAFTRRVGVAVTHPVGKYLVAGTAVGMLVLCAPIALLHSKVGDASAGTPLLWPDHEFNRATETIANTFGGVDRLVVFVDGDRANASTNPALIHAMEEFQRALAAETDLRAAVSIVPQLRTMWQNYHYGDPKWAFVPDDPGTVRTMLFQMQQNGPPGFLRPYLSDDGSDATIAFVYPDQTSNTVRRAVHFAEDFIANHPLGEVNIRLVKASGEPGAPWFSRGRLADVAYYLIGPLLPPRHHALSVGIRQHDGSYVAQPISDVSTHVLPDWIGAFREDAILAADQAAGATRWTLDHVGQWWEDENFGIRAVEVANRYLFVSDRKAIDKSPQLQPAQTWTRGAQFVMAGGSIGITAAVNEEVERSHVANITLIFLVIFVLHSITYRSIPSGAILLLQIATATMISLAYMAARGIGLNINTLPVQAVGIGIGVDYAIYIVDRIRQEFINTQDVDEAVRRAVETTGMAVTFTATTITGGIFLWVFSDLRFQAEMAYLLVLLMSLNMLGAITVVPALYSILRPRVATKLGATQGAAKDPRSSNPRVA